MQSDMEGVSQHAISADLHILHTLLSRNLDSASLPESVREMQSKYTGVLNRLLRNKPPLRRNLVDLVSADLIKKENLEKQLENYCPAFNTGGGDCFYKSLSIFFWGNEDYSNILRLLASAELFINCDFYIRYFSILWRSLNNPKNDLVNFQYILSNNSSDKILSPSDYVDAMKHEALLNAKDSTYVAFVFFPVMSRILSCSIQLIYAKSANTYFYEILCLLFTCFTYMSYFA